MIEKSRERKKHHPFEQKREIEFDVIIVSTAMKITFSCSPQILVSKFN